MDRMQKLLVRIDKSMKVLEIGPSFSPVAPRATGWNTWTVDHTDQKGLREKYRADPSVDVSLIGPVDFLWNAGELDQAIPAEHHGTFDACIASHVIEHLPDPVGFYRSLDPLMRPNGVLAIAVPDKRFCFDYFRPLSMTSEFILAYQQRRCRHTKKTAFEHTAYTITADGKLAWGQHPVANFRFFDNLQIAIERLANTDESEASKYQDYHAWCYTPSSFRLMILELNVLELIDWQIDVDYPPEGCEFIAILKKGRTSFTSGLELQEVRRELLTGIIADIAEQHDYAVARAVPAAAGTLPVTAGSTLTDELAALRQETRDLGERLARQEARLAKIWDSAKMTKRLLLPLRVVARAAHSMRRGLS